MTADIQRAARAIRLRNVRRSHPDIAEADLRPLDEMAPGITKMYEEQAAAAISAAFLDPSDEVVLAAGRAVCEAEACATPLRFPCESCNKSDGCISSARAALRAAAMRVLGQ